MKRVQLEETVDFFFNTVDSAGAPTALAGSPAVALYKNNSTDEISSGVTLNASFDSRTGLNHVRAALTAANGWAEGDSVQAVITAGTVGGSSVAGYTILEGQFKIAAADEAITLADVRSALGLSSANLDAQIAALPTAAENRAEIDSNSTQLAAIIADTGTDIPATLATIAGYVDTEVAAILTDTGTTIPGTLSAISSSISSLQETANTLSSGIITGQAQTGTLSTTQATTNLTDYTDDQLIGRIIIWISGACAGEATNITDYASTGGRLTYTAMTLAPANGDTFKIV